MLKHLAVVQIPRDFAADGAICRGKEGRLDYRLFRTSDRPHLADLFPGTKLLGYWAFRVTRNSELYIDEEETANLLKAVENELHNRRKGDAVRLEVEHDCPADIREALLKTLAPDRGGSLSH